MTLLSRIRLKQTSSLRLTSRNPNFYTCARHNSVIKSFHVKPHTNELSPELYTQPEPAPEDEIVIAMSAGVDSSVSAALYKSKYANVRGIYMANWSQTAKCTERDWNDVQRICHDLDIPCERVNFEKEYWNDVFEPMISMYARGLTPNPDTGCNKYVKFGKMIQHLTEKFSTSDKKWWLVTGHYARIMQHNQTGDFHLLRGYYGNKDQSFYLSNVPQSVLSKILMPIGHMIKPQVRQLAQQHHLHIADKPDSQGLCFVGQDTKNFRDFLNEYIPPNPGNIITEDGRVWGQHQGLWHATIGQKSGFSMPQGDPELKGVWFVSEKRVATNEIVIVKGGDNPRLFHNGVLVRDWEWLTSQGESIDTIVSKPGLKMQYRALQDPETVDWCKWDENSQSITIKLTNTARAMPPGQNVVLYDGCRVLGSGILDSTHDY